MSMNHRTNNGGVMHPFLIQQLSNDRRDRLIHQAESRRLAKLAPHPVKAPRDFSATLVVAAPYELTALNLPTKARNDPHAIELEPTLMSTPHGPRTPDSIKIGATWQSRRSRVRSADVEIRAGGATWTYLTVHLLAPLPRRRHRVESAAWSLAGAIRDNIEGRLPRFTVPFSVLAARPAPRELVAAASEAE